MYEICILLKTLLSQNKELPVKSKESFLTRCSDFILDMLPPSQHDKVLGAKRFHFFKGKTSNDTKVLIQLVDGRTFQGGLTDRFKGIVSAFCVAQIKCRAFKINYTSPFNLSDYLKPNEIDWVIEKKSDISSNFFQARLFFFERNDGKKGIERIRKVGNILQMHCYCKGVLYQILTRGDGSHFDWGKEFKRLFTPTTQLQYRITDCKNDIGGAYVAAVFRFQNLLGDFEEYQYKEADTKRKEALIAACKKAIDSLQKQNGESRVLVTADSVRFLEEIKDLPGVYAFPAKVAHMDWAGRQAYETYLKSFLDFYLIAGATKVFSVGTSEMYKSDFPKYAAMLENVPFERILIKE